MADYGCSDSAHEAGRSPTVYRYASGGQAILYIADGGIQWRALRLFELVRSAGIQDCDAGSRSGQPDGLEDAANWQGTGKGMGDFNRKLNRMDLHRKHPRHDTKARNILPLFMNF